jgi:hypothetical protein
MPTSGSIHNLAVSLNNAPGTGQSTTFTLTKNGAETSLSCAIVDSNAACSNIIDSVDIASGDHIMMKVLGTAPPAGLQSTALSSVVFDTP